MMKNKVVVLLSGGMDSVTVLYHSLKEYDVIGALSFNYGSKHAHQELEYAKYHCDKVGIKHTVIKLDFVQQLFKSSLLIDGGEIPEGHYAAENMKSTVVPFRNGIMLSIACGFAESQGANAVAIAAHSGDHAIYPDCRTNFMEAMRAAMQLGTYESIDLLAPFVDIDKTEIVRIGAKLNVDYSQTWSCYKGLELHCGKCGTCVERKEAFELAGVPDPTKYQ